MKILGLYIFYPAQNPAYPTKNICKGAVLCTDLITVSGPRLA